MPCRKVQTYRVRVKKEEFMKWVLTVGGGADDIMFLRIGGIFFGGRLPCRARVVKGNFRVSE